MSLDLTTLRPWFQDRLGFTVEAAEKITGGQSNPTYLLRGAGQAVVLRRKPGGALLKSAHAVDREFRVQRALAEGQVPVAKMLIYCDDPSIVGAEFYIMEHVVGRVFDDPALPQILPAEKNPYFKEMASVLAAIHQVDLKRVELTDYGPGAGYLRRQIDRWTKQYRASETDRIPAMERLMEILDRHCPADDGRVTLVHGDYRMDNLMFSPDGPNVFAVLDWELSTLGHPFADLAAVIMQWRMPSGAEGRGLEGVDREAHGLPQDDLFISWYSERMGLKKIENFDFFLAFCFFRMASILQGVLRRSLDGNASDPERGRRLGSHVPRYAAMGLEILG